MLEGLPSLYYDLLSNLGSRFEVIACGCDYEVKGSSKLVNRVGMGFAMGLCCFTLSPWNSRDASGGEIADRVYVINYLNYVKKWDIIWLHLPAKCMQKKHDVSIGKMLAAELGIVWVELRKLLTLVGWAGLRSTGLAQMRTRTSAGSSSYYLLGFDSIAESNAKKVWIRLSMTCRSHPCFQKSDQCSQIFSYGGGKPSPRKGRKSKPKDFITSEFQQAPTREEFDITKVRPDIDMDDNSLFMWEDRGGITISCWCKYSCQYNSVARIMERSAVKIGRGY